MQTIDRFIGRAKELSEIATCAARGDRLVTLLGPPGIGKTRLARRYLEDVRAEGGALFCDLSAARGADDLAAAVARLFDVRRADDVVAALADAGPIVLVLDNLETIAHAAAAPLAEWCLKAPEAFFLVTSRSRLGVAGEVVVEIPPLDLETDAVALFLERARVAESAAVRPLMRALDGIPLAIELAAARSRLLGPDKLLERLGRGGAVLADRSRDPRHSTLRAAIDASWELLDAAERSVLAQCSIFAGAFTIEAAEAVIDAPDVLDALASLHDRSLLRAAGDGRFSMYAAIREYAAEQMTDRPAVAERHRRWVLDATRGLYDAFTRTGDSDARKALAAAKDELLAVGDDAQAILYLEPTLAVESGYDELLGTLERGISLAGDDAVRGRLIMARGNARGIRGHLEASLADFESARGIGKAAMDRALEAEALMFSGVRYRNLGRFAEARAAGTEALRVLGDSTLPRIEGACRAVMGLLLFELGESEAARISNLRARAIFDAAGDRWSEALPLANLAQLDQAAGEHERSAHEYDAALERFREHGDRRYEARYLGYRAGLEHERGALSAARGIYATALELLSSLGIAPTEGLFRAGLAALEASEGHSEQALRELDRAEVLLATVVAPSAASALDVHRGQIDLLLAQRASDPERAASLVARAQQRLRDVRLADLSEDVRFAVRLLERALAGAAPTPIAPRAGLVVSANGFQVGDQPPVDLGRRAALRFILAALVKAKGSPLTADELLATGWPGEKVIGDAGGNRVRVAISTLRRLGLASVLLTSDAGYFLESRALSPG